MSCTGVTGFAFPTSVVLTRATRLGLKRTSQDLIVCLIVLGLRSYLGSVCGEVVRSFLFSLKAD